MTTDEKAPNRDQADLIERLKEAAAKATPGAWFEGDKWVFVPPVDPENNQTSALRNILRDVPEDELQANCAYIAICSPDNILSLLDRLASSATRIAELEAENKSLGDEIDNLEEEGCDYDDTIRKLETRLATTQSALDEAREALEPFAYEADWHEQVHGKDADGDREVLTLLKQLRRARAATRTAGGEDAA